MRRRFSSSTPAIGVAAVVALVAAAVAVGRSARSAAPGGGFFPNNPAARGPAEGSRGASSDAVAGGLPLEVAARNVQDAADDPMSLDEFLGLLTETVPAPLAERVKEEFQKNLQLQRAWNVYKNEAGPKAPAKEFIAFITRIPQFRELVAKFHSDPGFKQAVTAVGGRSDLGPLLREGLQTLPPAGSVARTPEQAAIAREWERKALSGMKLARFTMASAGPVGRAGARASAAAAGVAASPASTSGAPVSAGGPQDAARGGESVPGGLKPGQGSHNATKLDASWKGKPIDDTANFVDSRKWLTKFLLALDEETRKSVQAKLESGEEDLWGACYTTGHFDECKAVCQKVPEAKCENKDRWEACRSAGTRGSKECVQSCLGSTGPLSCDPHRAEWDPLCKAKDVGKDFCLSAQPWGPQVCLAQYGQTRCEQPVGALDGGSGAGAVTAGAASGASSCGSEIEMSAPPCQRLLVLLAQVRAAQAAAAAAAAAARGQDPDQRGQGVTGDGDPIGCTYAGVCPSGSYWDSCTGSCVLTACVPTNQHQGESWWDKVKDGAKTAAKTVVNVSKKAVEIGKKVLCIGPWC